MRFTAILILISSWTNLNGTPQAPSPPPDFRFKTEVLAQGMPQPMELEVAPDGRIFFNELGGALKIFHPSTGRISEAGHLEVFTEQENGFLGFALDPEFHSNHWIYLFYSPKDQPGQRLSRFSMQEDTLAMDSEQVLLEFSVQRRECCHHAGSVEFGPDGCLFVSTGDNTHPGGDSSGYAPIDERPDRGPFDAQKSSANTHDLRGKILRIRPEQDGTYSIPPGNLFPLDGSEGRPEIYVMGCRNPWRISVDQRTGIVYWGEVGPDAGGDTARGPRGYDEINQARSAGNYGWPYFVGNNFAYADFDFATQEAGPPYDPARPANRSPNNTGAEFLPPAQPAFIYWPYGDSSEFPMLGSGGRTACAGPVFYFEPGFKDTGGFPDFFDNRLLFYDWQRPFMQWARLDEKANLIQIEPFTTAITVANDRDTVARARAEGQFVVQRPVDSEFGPDGCLYLLDYGATWGRNEDSQLIKISYQWGNLAPLARAKATPPSGALPLQLRLSGENSFDHEGDPLQFQWRLHPGGEVISSEPSHSLTIEDAGNYVVELRVTDTHGAQSSTTLPIVAGNTAPQVAFSQPQPGDFFVPGRPLEFRISVTDQEDGRSQDFDELYEPRTFASVTWLKGDDSSAVLEPGLALMKASDCFNCHSVQQKIVGPSFIEIADRYRDQSEALEVTVTRVIEGSSGVWSEVPMLPHQNLHPDQVRMMVGWIYGLTRENLGSDAMVRGLFGSITPPQEKDLTAVILEASYTDLGQPRVNPLTTTTSIRLRHHRVQAELADEKHGPRVLGDFLGAIDHGHYARLANCNLAGSKSVTFRVASGGSGGLIELRARSVDGPLLASTAVEPTGGWHDWVERTVPLDNLSAKPQDLFVVFVNPGKGGLMNLDWLEFN